MGHTLTGDQHREFSRKLAEICRQLGQAEYPYDPQRALKALQDVIEGRFVLSPSQRFVPHLLPEWEHEMIEDVEPTLAPGAKLSFPSFFRETDGGRVDGPTMRNRAKEMKANYGLSDAPVILGLDGKGLSTIPAELRGKVYIVLAGTVLRDSGGSLFVPYLCWNGDAWVVDFDLLSIDWHDFDRLVSCE
jgi:hypothetical protein